MRCTIAHEKFSELKSNFLFVNLSEVLYIGKRGDHIWEKWVGSGQRKNPWNT